MCKFTHMAKRADPEDDFDQFCYVYSYCCGVNSCMESDPAHPEGHSKSVCNCTLTPEDDLIY